MFSFLKTPAFRWILLITSFLVLVGVVRSFWGSPFSEPEVYRIARDREFRGVALWGNDTKLLGFSNELLISIARQQGFYLEFIDVNSRQLFEGLEDENYEAVISWLPEDALSKEKYFSQPFYLLTPVLVINKNSKISSPSDLIGKSVGIIHGSPLLVRNLTLPHVNFFPYNNVAVALDDLSKDRMDGLVIDLFSAYSFANGIYKDKVVIVPIKLTNDAIRLITLKNGPAKNLIPMFDKGLEELKLNGTYNKLLQKWDLENINQ